MPAPIINKREGVPAPLTIMIIPRIILTILFLVAACAVAVQAQHLNIKNYGPDEGLPQPQVLSIFQDSLGYMWFGTHAGVCRYNGVTFEVFDTSNGLMSNTVVDIDEDAQGQMYFATRRGLSVYDGKSFKHYHSGNGLPGDLVYDVLVESDGTIWVATTGGISCLRGEAIKKYKLDEKLGEKYCSVVYRSSNGQLLAGCNKGYYALRGDEFTRQKLDEDDDDPKVNFFIEDLEGSTWIGTTRGLYRKDGSNTTLIDPELVDSHVLSLSAVIEKDGTLWFGTGIGVLRYAGAEFKYYITKNGLFHNTVYDCYIDNEDNIWFGTAIGASKLRQGEFLFFDENSGLVENSVCRIYEDSRKRLWVSSWESGITVIEENKIWTLTREDGLTDPFVVATVEMPDGAILIGTVRSMFIWNEGTLVIPKDSFGVSYLYRDSRDRIWIGRFLGAAVWESGAPKKLDEDERFPKSYVHCITEDQDGNIWFGTREEGCYVFNGLESIVYDKDDGLTNLEIQSIDTDLSGRVWIGSRGDGVFYYDGEKFINYNKEDGLSDNYVWQVLADSEGNVWFGTSSGIDLFDGKSFRHFDTSDGLAYKEGIEDACLEDSAGRLWFGSIKGLSQHVGSKYDHSAFHPPVHIESSAASNYPFKLTSGVELAPDANNLVFNFIGLSFRDEKKVEYRYMLDGLDSDWSDPTNDRSVRYTNVPPGDYTFKVTARSNIGLWSSDPATVTFSILPHFYQTHWFIALVILLSSIVIITCHRLIVGKVKRDKARLEQIVHDRTSEISAANEELKAINYSVSHDLRAPLRYVEGYSQILIDSCAPKLDEQEITYLGRIQNSVKRMGGLIDDMLKLSRATRGELTCEEVDISLLARKIASDMQESEPERRVEFSIAEKTVANCDVKMIDIVLENLLGNAWKFTKKQPHAKIEFGLAEHQRGVEFFVRDNGVGFSPEKAGQLFIPFKRLHTAEEFEGTGIGLATVKRIINRHGGRVWAEAEEGIGATFYFTLN